MAMQGLIFDLNGTLYFKERALEGAAETLQALRKRGYTMRFMTNTDSKTRMQLHELICDYGLDIPINEIFSAAHATYEYLRNNNYSFTGLLPENLSTDFKHLRRDDEKPDCVLIGENHRDISYDNLDKLFRHLMQGAELIVMQPGRHYFLADGPHLDTGSLAAMFEYATGQQAINMAKPSTQFFDLVLNDMKLKGNEVVVIGDDIETDMIGAAKIGAPSILLRTGKYQSADELLAKVKPNAVLDDISKLPDALELL